MMECTDFNLLLPPVGFGKNNGPSQSEIRQQKKAQKKQEQMLRRQMRAQERATRAALRAIHAPAQVVPEPDIAPPPPPAAQVSSSADIIAAERDEARQLKRRRGLSLTRRAGETGGFGKNLGGGSSLLGNSTIAA